MEGRLSSGRRWKGVSAAIFSDRNDGSRTGRRFGKGWYFGGGMMNLNPSSIKCLTENIETERRRRHRSKQLCFNATNAWLAVDTISLWIRKSEQERLIFCCLKDFETRRRLISAVSYMVVSNWEGSTCHETAFDRDAILPVTCPPPFGVAWEILTLQWTTAPGALAEGHMDLSPDVNAVI
jgi:hypothetical protein